MTRVGVVLSVGAVLGLSGCKVPGGPTDGVADPRPALLIGPDSGAKAPAIELPPKEAARTCLRTALEYEKAGQVEEAIRLYERARSLDPGLTLAASRRLAVLYDLTENFAKSTAEYEAQLKAHPKDADLLNDVGYSYYCRGDWANAEAYLGRALKADPQHKRATMHLAMAYAAQGRWDDAFQQFCRAVRPADAHCNMAFLLASLGQTDAAKDQYRRALELDPALKLARAGLAKLENPGPRDAAVVPAGGVPAGKKVRFDPVEAAAKVPTIEELEARMKREGALTPVAAEAGVQIGDR